MNGQRQYLNVVPNEMSLLLLGIMCNARLCKPAILLAELPSVSFWHYYRSFL
jgi:hypothetical protein